MCARSMHVALGALGEARALVAPALRPKVLERWRTTVVQPAIDNVIDAFIDHDRVDVVE